MRRVLIGIIAAGALGTGCATTKGASGAGDAAVTGQIDGREFKSVVALMRTNPADGIPESKIINVYEKGFTCDDFPSEDGERYLDIAITMNESPRAEGSYLQFTTLADGGNLNSVTGSSGAVEVVSQSPLRIKVDAKGDEKNFLKGTIDVQECAK